MYSFALKDLNLYLDVYPEDKEALERLKRLISPFPLRRVKKDVLTELPEKTITVLNPMKLLESGYSIVKNKDKVITSIKYINIDDLVNIDLKDGVIKAKVVSKENKNNDQRW